MGKQKLEILQVGRGCSALAVVAYHAWLSIRDFTDLPAGVFGKSLSEGYLGVDFFFVLSGFIILQVHERDARTAAAARAYARKRLLRIYVPYLPIGGAMAIAYCLAPGLSGATKGWSLLSSLTLIPTGNWPALSVAWTLEHELMFYGLFLLFYTVRRFLYVVVIWSILIVLASLVRPAFPGGVPGAVCRTLLAPINLEFIFGMVACLACRRMTPRCSYALMSGGLIWLVAYVAAEPAVELRELFGCGVAVFVCGAVSLERSGRIGGWAPLIALGNASYAIYLVHDPVISLVARITRGTMFHWWVVLPACVAASLILGFAYHWFFEEPVRHFLARRLNGQSMLGGQRA